MWNGEERRENNGETTALIIYRLDQAEKKVESLEGKFNTFNNGFIELKAELSHVAKNEGKTSGAISGVVGSLLVGMALVMAEAVFKVGG